MKLHTYNLKSIVLPIFFILINNVSAQMLTASDTTDFFNWTAIDADGDNNNWNIVDLTGVGTSLDAQGGCVISSSWSPSCGILFPDNYLISPSIDLSNTVGSLSLSFKVGSIESSSSNWFGEWISVYAVTDSSINYISNCTPIHSDSLLSGQQMFEFAYDISSLCGNSNVYIVFRHHNCNDENFIILDDIEVSNPVGISENNMEFSIYPNPSSELLNINYNLSISLISIYNMEGKLILEKKDNLMTENINIKSLIPGSYLCKIQLENGSCLQKVFIKN